MSAILGNTDIKTLLDNNPQAARVMLRHGMACIGCDISRFHTIEEIATVYHLEPTAFLEEILQSTNTRDSE